MQREAVNARQQAAIAKLLMVQIATIDRGADLKAATQNTSAGFKPQQRLQCFRDWQRQKFSQVRCRGWTKVHHPSGHQCEQRILGRGHDDTKIRQGVSEFCLGIDYVYRSRSLRASPEGMTVNQYAGGSPCRP